MSSEPPGKPVRHPFPLRCEAGRKYAYCMCQQSARFPLCDGTHREKNEALPEAEHVLPRKFIPEEAQTVMLCACGRSGNRPYCDGSHGAL